MCSNTFIIILDISIIALKMHKIPLIYKKSVGKFQYNLVLSKKFSKPVRIFRIYFHDDQFEISQNNRLPRFTEVLLP